jgi:hypothetical protein
MVLALGGVPRRPRQSFHYVLLGYCLDRGVSRQGIGFEALTVKSLQRGTVGEKPRFHALDHQVDASVWHGLRPSVPVAQMCARALAGGNRRFRVYQ